MVPIIVDPNSPVPDPPDTGTSPDGLLTATYLPGSTTSTFCRPFCERYPCDSDAAESKPGGVYLVADYSSAFNVTPDPMFLDAGYLNVQRFPGYYDITSDGTPLPTGTIRIVGYSEAGEEIITGTNLLNDPSFEYGVDGWSAMVTQDGEHVHTGGQALRVEGTSGNPPTYDSRRAFNAEAGKTYTFSAWQWVPAGTVRTHQLAMGQGVATQVVYNDDVTQYDQWQYVTVTNTAAATGIMYVHLYGDESTTDKKFVWYDDAGLTEGGHPVDFNGDTADTADTFYRWTGTPGSSTSERYIITGAVDAELPGMRMWMIGDQSWTKQATRPTSGYQQVPGGSSWFLSYEVNPSRSHSFRCQAVWLLDDGTLTANQYSPVIAAAEGVWTTISATFTAPDNAVGLAWAINVVGTPTDPLQFLLRNPITVNASLSPDGKKIDGVRFIRVDSKGNEYPVRGGDPATALGGIAYAFDAEAPLGETSQWYAIPVYSDGTEGSPSEAVALYLPWPTGDLDCWLKPISDLNASTMGQIIFPLPNFTRASRNQLSPVQGSRLQAGGWDLHLAPEATFTFWTPDCIERNKIITALTSGPLLLQCHPDYQIPDTYVLAGDITEAPLETTLRDPGRIWTVPLTPVARPSTADTPAVVLGRSYADTHQAAGTYQVRYNMWPTYADVSRPISVPIGSPAGDALRGDNHA